MYLCVLDEDNEYSNSTIRTFMWYDSTSKIEMSLNSGNKSNSHWNIQYDGNRSSTINSTGEFVSEIVEQ